MTWNVSGQALDFDFAQHLLKNSAFGLHTKRHALKNNRYVDPQRPVHGYTLEVDVQQMAFDRFILPVHNHYLGSFAAMQCEIENGVVAAVGSQNAQHMTRIDANWQRVLAGTVYYAGDFAFAPHAPGMVLGTRFPRLGFQSILFNRSRHNFSSCLRLLE